MIITTSTTDSPEEVQRAMSSIGLEADLEVLENEAQPTPSDPAPATPPAEAQPTGETAAPPTQEPAPKPKNKVPASQRIAELVAERHQRDTVIEERTREIENLKRQIADAAKPPQAPPPPEPKPAEVVKAAKPTPQDLDKDGNALFEGPWDPNFIEAMTDWKAQEVAAGMKAEVESLRAELAKREETREAQTTEQAQIADFQDRGRQAHTDWDEIAARPETAQVQFSPSFGQAMMTESDLGPSILYHLAQHPDDAKRIFEATQLKPDAPPAEVLRVQRVVGRELARLENVVKAAYGTGGTPATPKPVEQPPSSAPEPVTPVRGTAPGTVADPHTNTMSHKEYMAWWNRKHGIQ